MISLLLVLLSASSASTAVDPTEPLITGLGLDAIPELRQSVDVAVSAEPEASRWVGSVSASLLARGIRAMALEGSDAALIDKGAEWRLALKSDGHTLSASLTEIDPGLFGRALSDPVPRATATVDLEPTTVPVPPSSTIKPRLGALSQLGALSDRVLAMDACGGPSGELLLVLTLDHLYAYTVERRRLELFAELALDLSTPAKMPTRNPIGSVVCAETTNGTWLIGMGHSRLAGGATARLDPKATGKNRLVLGPRLPAVPLARVGGRWLYGNADQGRNRWTGWAWGNDDATPIDPKALGAMYAVCGVRDERGVSTELWATDLADHLAFLDARLAGSPGAERSGTGTSARRISGERIVVTTDVTRGREHVGLLGSSTRIPIDDAVAASTILRADASTWWVVLAVDRGPKGATLHTAELRLGDQP